MPTPLYVVKALAKVRESGLTNMLDRDAVEMLVTDQRAAEWISKVTDNEYIIALTDMADAESENFMDTRTAAMVEEDSKAEAGRIAELEEEGRKLAVKTSWDGYDILIIAQAALTDANFHHEAAIVSQMIEALDKYDNPAFTLTTLDGDSIEIG